MVHTFGICDKSSRAALSVFSRVFARGECGPARLRGSRSAQLQGRRRDTRLGQEVLLVHLRGCGWT